MPISLFSILVFFFFVYLFYPLFSSSTYLISIMGKEININERERKENIFLEETHWSHSIFSFIRSRLWSSRLFFSFHFFSIACSHSDILYSQMEINSFRFVWFGFICLCLTSLNDSVLKCFQHKFYFSLTLVYTLVVKNDYRIN